jgi:adenylate kinase
VRLLLLAPPGAGKGTQAHRLAEHFGIEHISTGDLLRQEVAAGTPFGLQAKEFLDRGDLVPDGLIRDMVVDRLIEADARGGFLLDGYPRNRAQAEQAQRMAAEHGITLDGAIYLDVGRDEALRRILGRAGADGRTDDRADTVRHRLDVFDHATRPLAGYYRDRGLLIAIDGEQPVDQVTAEILDRLGGGATPSAARDQPPPDGGSR